MTNKVTKKRKWDVSPRQAETSQNLLKNEVIITWMQ